MQTYFAEQSKTKLFLYSDKCFNHFGKRIRVFPARCLMLRGGRKVPIKLLFVRSILSPLEKLSIRAINQKCSLCGFLHRQSDSLSQ